MWRGSRCSAWQQECTQSVCPYVWGRCMWVYACGSSTSFPTKMTYFQWLHNYLFFFLSFWYLFHPLQRNIREFLTVIYKAFIIVGSTMIKGELPTSARAFHFQRFDGSWSWIWCSTGVVCLPQVVNNNKAETNDEELVDPILCAHKVHIKYFPWDIHCYSLQNVDSCKNPGHSENFTLIV